MSEQASRTDFKFALLNLIEETEIFASYADKLQSWGPNFTRAAEFDTLYNASCKSINDGLRDIGGFDATIDASDTTPELHVKLVEWHGKHPVEPDKYRWLGMLGAARVPLEVTLGREAVEELRQKLLLEAITDV